MRYAIDSARRVLFIELLDVSDSVSTVRALERIDADAAFEPDIDAYVDCNHLNHLVTANDVQSMALLASHGTPGFDGRVAIVAPETRAFDSARLFIVLASLRTDRARVFRTRSEALTWLEVVPTPVLVRPTESAAVAPDRGVTAPAQLPQAPRAPARTARRPASTPPETIDVLCLGGRCQGERRSVAPKVGQRYLITTDDGRAGWYMLTHDSGGVPRLVHEDTEFVDRRGTRPSRSA